MKPFYFSAIVGLWLVQGESLGFDLPCHSSLLNFRRFGTGGTGRAIQILASTCPLEVKASVACLPPNKNNLMESPIQLNIPLSVSYAAVEGALQQQVVGEYIPKPGESSEERPFAQVLGVGVAGSSANPYNLLLRVQLRVMRTVLKRDKVDLYVLVALAYDNASQQLYVRQFSMESNTSSGFYNTSLEVLVNKVAYNQIIKRARVDLKEIIATELAKVNSQLEQGMELKGVKLKGAVAAVGVQDIVPLADRISLRLLVQAELEVAVFDLISLMPPKTEEG